MPNIDYFVVILIVYLYSIFPIRLILSCDNNINISRYNNNTTNFLCMDGLMGIDSTSCGAFLPCTIQMAIINAVNYSIIIVSVNYVNYLWEFRIIGV
jgi:hypothetical protein